jgi:hypothetical protein
VEKNEACAKILGGKERALKLVEKMGAIIDTTTPGFRLESIPAARQKERDLAKRVQTGADDLAAGVFWPTRGPQSSVWNENPFHVYVGPLFWRMTANFQLIKLIHELAHAHLGTGEHPSSFPSDEAISEACNIRI